MSDAVPQTEQNIETTPDDAAAEHLDALLGIEPEQTATRVEVRGLVRNPPRVAPAER